MSLFPIFQVAVKYLKIPDVLSLLFHYRFWKELFAIKYNVSARFIYIITLNVAISHFFCEAETSLTPLWAIKVSLHFFAVRIGYLKHLSCDSMRLGPASHPYFRVLHNCATVPGWPLIFGLATYPAGKSYRMAYEECLLLQALFWPWYASEWTSRGAPGTRGQGTPALQEQLPSSTSSRRVRRHIWYTWSGNADIAGDRCYRN